MSQLRTVTLAAAVCLALLVGCDRSGGRSPSLPLGMTDVTPASGIDFTTTFGRTPASEILEVKGGGVALIDVENDGDLDVFVSNGATLAAPDEGPGARLFENQGGLRFSDRTEEWAIDFRRWGVGALAGDYDGDGRTDLFVTAFGANALLRNQGGRFADVTKEAKVGDSHWGVAASYGDLDQDGDLDLYVANYLEFDVANPPPPSTFKGAPVFRGPIGLVPQPDLLYENRGDGTFADVSASSGIRTVEPGYGLGALILDFDADGRLDVFVGNDSTPNRLFLNRGGGRFSDEGLRSGLAANVYGSTQATMGIAVGDVNSNGFPDVFTTNFSNDTNTLHLNEAGRFFDDRTAAYGLGMLSFPYVGWAAGFYDLDLDADEDLLVFNGHVYSNATAAVMDAEHLQPPLLYAREGERFRRVEAGEAGAWLGEPHGDRGAAFGDLDGDGDVDVVVLERNGPLRVLRNDADVERGNWLSVGLDPPSPGSRVQVSGGGRTWTRWIQAGGGFASSSAQVAHFGLPRDLAEVTVTVAWPDGGQSHHEGLPTRQHATLER